MMLVLLSVSFLLQDEQTKPTDLDRMQGEWSILEGTKNGKPWPEEEIAKMSFKVKGNSFLLDSPRSKKPSVTLVELDSSKSPKEFKMNQRGGQNGKFIFGIYEIKKDNLKICWSLNGKKPFDFDAKKARLSLSMTRNDHSE